MRVLEIVKRLLGPIAFWTAVFVACILGVLWAQQTFAFVGTMTDETASRSLATDYENTTGNDLIVMVTIQLNASGSHKVRGYIGNPTTDQLVAEQGDVSCSGSSCRDQITFVVPAGYFYEAFNTGDATLLEWWEYETPAMSGGGGGTTTTEQVVHNPTLDLWLGFMAFFMIFAFIVWFFRRPYDTY